MPKDLISPKYSAQLVEEVTGADLPSQRNWIARDIYGSGALITPVLAGKSRMFPLIAVYETAGMVEARAQGFDPSFFGAAMSRRVEVLGNPEMWKRKPAITPGGAIAFWEGELIEAAAEKMTEFVETPVDHYWWVANFEKDEIGGGRSVSTLHVVRGGQFKLSQAKKERGMFLVVDITELVSTVDENLRALGEM